MLIRKCFSIATVTAGLLLVGSANVQAIEIVVPGGIVEIDDDGDISVGPVTVNPGDLIPENGSPGFYGTGRDRDPNRGRRRSHFDRLGDDFRREARDYGRRGRGPSGPPPRTQAEFFRGHRESYRRRTAPPPRAIIDPSVLQVRPLPPVFFHTPPPQHFHTPLPQDFERPYSAPPVGPVVDHPSERIGDYVPDVEPERIGDYVPDVETERIGDYVPDVDHDVNASVHVSNRDLNRAAAVLVTGSVLSAPAADYYNSDLPDHHEDVAGDTFRTVFGSGGGGGPRFSSSTGNPDHPGMGGYYRAETYDEAETGGSETEDLDEPVEVSGIAQNSDPVTEPEQDRGPTDLDEDQRITPPEIVTGAYLTSPNQNARGKQNAQRKVKKTNTPELPTGFLTTLRCASHQKVTITPSLPTFTDDVPVAFGK